MDAIFFGEFEEKKNFYFGDGGATAGPAPVWEPMPPTVAAVRRAEEAARAVDNADNADGAPAPPVVPAGGRGSRNRPRGDNGLVVVVAESVKLMRTILILMMIHYHSN